MKTLWNMLSFLAVVNLLALVMLLAWLWRSDRLDRGRIEQLRGLFAPTITEVREAEAAAVRAEAERQAGAEPADPLLTGTAQLAQLSRIRQQELISRRRLESERRLLVAEIESRAELLQSRESDLDLALQVEEAGRDEDRQRAAEAQFAKAVRQLESIPPRQGKAILTAIIDDRGMEQAVAYLDAMDPRGSARILREFKTVEETRLATQLLEGLRSHGLDGSDEDPAHAQSAARSAPASRGDAESGPSS